MEKSDGESLLPSRRSSFEPVSSLDPGLQGAGRYYPRQTRNITNGTAMGPDGDPASGDRGRANRVAST